MKKHTPVDHPIHELIADRWSPYWFSSRPVDPADLRSILEAARWAASSYNEQPWAFIVATRDDGAAHEQMVNCLIEGNQTWAREAPVLILGLTRGTFTRNGSANAAYQHDLGLAAATLTFEASARGLAVHQMTGILADTIRETYAVPDEYTPLTAIAVGFCATPQEVPERYKDRQNSERSRKPLSEFVFGGTWGKTSSHV